VGDGRLDFVVAPRFSEQLHLGLAIFNEPSLGGLERPRVTPAGRHLRVAIILHAGFLTQLGLALLSLPWRLAQGCSHNALPSAAMARTVPPARMPINKKVFLTFLLGLVVF